MHNHKDKNTVTYILHMCNTIRSLLSIHSIINFRSKEELQSNTVVRQTGRNNAYRNHISRLTSSCCVMLHLNKDSMMGC